MDTCFRVAEFKWLADSWRCVGAAVSRCTGQVLIYNVYERRSVFLRLVAVRSRRGLRRRGGVCVRERRRAAPHPLGVDDAARADDFVRAYE